MGCRGQIFTTLRDEPANVKLVFLVSEQLSNCRDTIWKGKPVARGEFITSLQNMADLTSLTVKLVRSALTRLTDLGVLKTSTEDRKFTRVRLPSVGTDSGTVSGIANVSKNRRESKKAGTVSGTDLGNSCKDVSLAVVQSPVVDVSHAVVGVNTESGAAAGPPPPPATAAKSRNGPEPTPKTEPGMADLVSHIETLFGSVVGERFPWRRGKDLEHIAYQVRIHGAAKLMTWADSFFTRENKFAELKGFRIDEFIYQLPVLMDKTALQKVRRYQADIDDRARGMKAPPAAPPTPSRRLPVTVSVEPIADWKPEEVTFTADLRRLQAEAKKLVPA